VLKLGSPVVSDLGLIGNGFANELLCSTRSDFWRPSVVLFSQDTFLGTLWKPAESKRWNQGASSTTIFQNYPLLIPIKPQVLLNRLHLPLQVGRDFVNLVPDSQQIPAYNLRDITLTNPGFQ
jgi:hypothetical protein